ncbi:MAG: hypothetical protein J0H62_00155, partial [Rhizobiales bacterium]|nr:hypothetical protein [Hyphomicrobiales bacterium]
MHVLMFLGGLIALAAGSTALGLGVLDHGGGSAGALIMPGAIGVIGGLALLGVGTIITRLAGIADILERQPVRRAIAEPAQQDIAMRSAVLAAERSGAPTITAEHMPPQPRIAPSVNPPVALSEPPRQPHAAPPVEPPVSVPSPASNATASAPPIPPPTHLTPHSAVAAALLDT